MKTAKQRILVVDDFVSLTTLVKVALEKTGRYEVCEQNDSTEALSSARAFHPDLILLDVDMPELDGGSVAEQIRSDRFLKHVPVVFPTGLISDREAKARNLCGGF